MSKKIAAKTKKPSKSAVPKKKQLAPREFPSVASSIGAVVYTLEVGREEALSLVLDHGFRLEDVKGDLHVCVADSRTARLYLSNKGG